MSAPAAPPGETAPSVSVKTEDGTVFVLPKALYEQCAYLKEQETVGEDEVELFDMTKEQMVRVVEFLTANADNPVPVDDFYQINPFAETGEEVAETAAAAGEAGGEKEPAPALPPAEEKIPLPLRALAMPRCTPQWAVTWLDTLDKLETVELAVVADSLGCHTLLTVLCARVALYLKVLSPEAFAETFQLAKEDMVDMDGNPMTEEDFEKEIRAENVWATA